MLAAKRLAALLIPLCSIVAANTARADDEPSLETPNLTPSSSQPIVVTTAPPKADTPAKSKSGKVAEITTATGAWLFVSSYVFAISVSLTADQACQGSICNERYLSFVPVFGGVLQFAVAGRSFHDQHHSDNCFPLTVADVTGQSIGVLGLATGLAMRYFAHKPSSKVNVAPTFDHGAGVALSVEM